MRFELKRIEIWPVFRITFFISGTLFLLFFLLMGNTIMQMSAVISESMGGVTGPSSIGIFGIIFGAVFYAAFFSGAMAAGAALYNVFSRQFGGYVFTFDGDFEIETVIEDLPPIAENDDGRNNGEGGALPPQ